MPIPIPGISIPDASTGSNHLITKSVNSVFNTFDGNQEVPSSGFKPDLSALNGNQLSPALAANLGFVKNTSIRAINIQTLILSQEADTSTNNVNSLDWEVTYQITLDSQGGKAQSDVKGGNSLAKLYKIILYFTYTKQVDPLSTDFNLYNAKVVFSTDNIVDHNGNSYPIDSIKSVEAFVINQDPETSRGTETTVQDDDETP